MQVTPFRYCNLAVGTVEDAGSYNAIFYFTSPRCSIQYSTCEAKP